MGSGGGLLTVCQEAGGSAGSDRSGPALPGSDRTGPVRPGRTATASSLCAVLPASLRAVLAARHLRMRYPGCMHFARLLLT
jgi:hypothetical protein